MGFESDAALVIRIDSEDSLALAISRAKKLIFFVKVKAPQVMIRNQMRMVREAIERWEDERAKEVDYG